MRKQRSKEPTERELDLLRVLWRRGPSSAREVFEAVRADGGEPTVQRTTVLKLLQIMLAKGLVVRDDAVTPQLYKAAWKPETVERLLLRGFIDRVFQGSSKNLVIRALDSTSLDEIAEIRRLIAEAASEVLEDE